MSTHVEWAVANQCSTEIVARGTEIGENTVDFADFALIINYDEVFVVEGSLANLRAFGQGIVDAVDAAIKNPPVFVPEMGDD